MQDLSLIHRGGERLLFPTEFRLLKIARDGSRKRGLEEELRIRSAKESVAASHTVLIVSRVMEMAIFGRSRIR